MVGRRAHGSRRRRRRRRPRKAPAAQFPQPQLRRRTTPHVISYSSSVPVPSAPSMWSSPAARRVPSSPATGRGTGRDGTRRSGMRRCPVCRCQPSSLLHSAQCSRSRMSMRILHSTFLTLGRGRGLISDGTADHETTSANRVSDSILK
jgi:hypothetical protein